MDLRSIYNAFVVRKKDTCLHREHPLLKLFGILIILAAVSLSNIEWLLLILLILIVEAALGKVVRNLIWTIKGAWSLLIILFIMSSVLYSLNYSIVLILRIISATFAISVFASTTLPSDLAQSLEEMGISSKLSAIPELSIRIIPYIAKDAQESLEGMMLRGEVKPAFLIPRGITKALATVVHSALKRSESLTETLVAKFFGYSGKRTYLEPLKITPYSILQLLVKGLLLYFSLTIPDISTCLMSFVSIVI